MNEIIAQQDEQCYNCADEIPKGSVCYSDGEEIIYCSECYNENRIVN